MRAEGLQERPMIVTAIICAVVAALIDYFFGIKEPWRKLIYIAIVILLILGVLMLIFPGLLPIRMV
jgi:membrane protein YdbS with pleckstrin-like domain